MFSFVLQPNLFDMKKIYFLFSSLFILIGIHVSAQPLICNPGGNIVVFSNYDGGVLNINVDQNIPNLKIGVVTYEPVTINLSGTYVGNVTGVVYAGYVSTTNHHCSNSPTTTTITGVPANITAVNYIPAATYNNPNGYSMIICNYSCSITTNQGGCNTPDQVIAYFQNVFGETSGALYSHFTQYGCWSTTPYNISAGGNCCVEPISTSIAENNSSVNSLSVSPNPSAGNFYVELPLGILAGDLKIFNVLGEEVRAMEISGSTTVSLEGETPGIYLMQFTSGGKTFSRKIVLTE